MSEKAILEQIKSVIENNKIALFMKGEKNAPRCGFSATAVKVLQSYQKPFEAVDILVDPQIRTVLSGYSGWPTIPQIFIDGKFVGGCDIIVEMHQAGEIAPLIKSAFGEE